MNQMRVVQGWFAGTYYTNQMLPSKQDLDPKVVDLLTTGICSNTAAHLVQDKAKGMEIIGNKTEGALLVFAEQQLDCNTEEKHKGVEESKSIIQQYTFTAAVKRSSVLVESESNNLQLHCKGAAEMVLSDCTRYLDKSETKPISAEMMKELENITEDMAEHGLRTLAVTYKDVESFANEDRLQMERDLVLIAIVGIKDPLRHESKEAVEQCKRSGIFVRMVTGDNIHTAKHIATECGILDPDGIAMEGKEFRAASDEYLLSILPRLQVLARFTPDDKLKLVKLIRTTNQVVAVTGDGTNVCKSIIDN